MKQKELSLTGGIEGFLDSNEAEARPFEQRMEAILEFFPLYELKQKHSLSDYYGFELGLSLLLFILEKMLRHSPCTYEDGEEFICFLLPRLLDRPLEEGEGVQVAQRLLEELTNRGSPFLYRFRHPFTGEERQVKFRLLEQRPLNLWGQDTVSLRLTEKGLDLLFKSREIYRDLHFSVMQLYLDQQIRRGVFEEAIHTVNELAVAVENIEEQCWKQRESIRRNVLESLNSKEYGRLLLRMEEQLHREQEIFESLKELVRETKQRLENSSLKPENQARREKISELGSVLNRVAARHLELIRNRIDLENLVGQVLRDSIYQGLMVRFHIKREFLGAVLQHNPPGEILIRTVLRPQLKANCPRLLGPETFLAPQRLLSRERERPLEDEPEELDAAAWEAYQKAEEERKERVITLLQRFFKGILESLIGRNSVTVMELTEKLLRSLPEPRETAALVHLLLILHQGRKIQARLPWDYVPGDEDLVEYAFYQLLLERPDLAQIGQVTVEAGPGVVTFPFGMEIKNLVLKRVEEDGVQPQDRRDLSGAVKRTPG
ncbi:MAG: hypothetical protein C4554_07260 [Dethiobacter sp.]|nr:MAG: hypothetical protein C4554_07260 [Dethiobacter sp.]